MDSTIRSILANHAKLSVPVDTVADTADLYNAGMTSHAGVTLMLALENEFGIEFPESMLRKSTFASISAIRQALQQLTGADVA
jgi:acyl carrier protein